MKLVPLDLWYMVLARRSYPCYPRPRTDKLSMGISILFYCGARFRVCLLVQTCPTCQHPVHVHNSGLDRPLPRRLVALEAMEASELLPPHIH